ncbi:hypothetical protein B0H14DRAFT_1100100 [Mycena olivaceomarginata]|nr:hypothetical protein B0H14DRAFT_1100100 [Mycena olivaceomarginata]
MELRPLKLSYAGLPRAALHSPILPISPPRGPLIASCSPPFDHIDLAPIVLRRRCATYLDEDRLHSLGESPAPLSCLLPLAGTDLRLRCRARTVPALVLPPPSSLSHAPHRASPRAPWRHLPRIPFFEECMHGSAASSKPLSCLQLQHQEEGWEKYEGGRSKNLYDVCLKLYIFPSQCKIPLNH